MHSNDVIETYNAPACPLQQRNNESKHNAKDAKLSPSCDTPLLCPLTFKSEVTRCS